MPFKVAQVTVITVAGVVVTIGAVLTKIILKAFEVMLIVPARAVALST